MLKEGDKAPSFNLESDEVGAFTRDDLELIKAFGSQAAVSLERAKLHTQILERRRLVDELEVARHIQRTFLPDVIPDIPGYDLSAINIPSQAVGGDYYDIIPISEGQWGITIADVFGKGVPAALVMASYRASLLAEIRNNYMINAILRKVNRLIWESVEPERCGSTHGTAGQGQDPLRQLGLRGLARDVDPTARAVETSNHGQPTLACQKRLEEAFRIRAQCRDGTQTGDCNARRTAHVSS